MSTKRLGIAVFVLTLLAFPASAGAPAGEVTDADWKLVKSTDGISVYRRSVDGSSIDEIRAEADVPASLNAVVALLEDVSLRVQWDPTCKEARQLLKQDEDSTRLVYYQLDLPWPVQDRDIVMRMQVSYAHEGQAASITSIATPGEEVPRSGDFVRIVQAREHWKLTETKPGVTRMRLLTHVEPAGPIPSWLINAMSADVPESMLYNIRRIVKDRDASIRARQSPGPPAR